MKNTTAFITAIFIAFGLGFAVHAFMTKTQKPNTKKATIVTHPEKPDHLKLGAFSLSLSVKDLQVSKAFYESLGFSAFGGDEQQNYLIMKNEHTLIGLFQGMFEGNMLTFNPGWDDLAQNTESFDDVRAIQKQLKAQNIKLSAEADDTTKGPASIMLSDPDGNVILIDQHR